MNAAQVALRNARGGADPIVLDARTVRLRELAKSQIDRDDFAGATATLAEISPPAEFKKIGTADIFAPLPPVDWLVQDLDMCAGPPALIAGYGYSKKTMGAQAAAVSITAGLPVWGTYQARRGRVLHVDYEQGRRLTLERYQRLLRGAELVPDALKDALTVVSMPRTYLDSFGAEEIFAQECDGYDLVIIDSLRAAAPSVDENNSHVRVVLDMLARVSERTGSAIWVIHHARKPNQDRSGGAKMAIRGSGAIFDACSSVLVFDADKDAPTNVSHEKARTSGRLAADFLLEVQDVEIDGDPRGGLRVTAREAPETPMAGKNESESMKRLKERAMDALVVHGPAESSSALVERFQGKKGDKYHAVRELIRDGKIDPGPPLKATGA